MVSLGPITVFKDTNFALLAGNRVLITNFIQRLLGITAFSMLFVQLMIGAFMQKWTEKLGGWVFNFHITEGVFIYILVFLHPVFFMLYNYFYGKGFDPFYIFLQACVLCRNTIDYYYSLGRFSFWLATMTVFAGLFRAATPFMRTNWRKFHVFNYVVFLLVGIHGLSLGTDFMKMPFFVFAIAAYLIVLYVVIFKKLPELIVNLRRWLT